MQKLYIGEIEKLNYFQHTVSMNRISSVFQDVKFVVNGSENR